MPEPVKPEQEVRREEEGEEVRTEEEEVRTEEEEESGDSEEERSLCRSPAKSPRKLSSILKRKRRPSEEEEEQEEEEEKEAEEEEEEEEAAEAKEPTDEDFQFKEPKLRKKKFIFQPLLRGGEGRGGAGGTVEVGGALQGIPPKRNTSPAFE